MKNVGSCGECPAQAISQKKYQSNDAMKFCVSSELGIFMGTPLKKELKKILSEEQWAAYQKNYKILKNYAKTARVLSRRNKTEKLAELYKQTQIRLAAL